MHNRDGLGGRTVCLPPRDSSNPRSRRLRPMAQMARTARRRARKGEPAHSSATTAARSSITCAALIGVDPVAGEASVQPGAARPVRTRIRPGFARQPAWAPPRRRVRTSRCVAQRFLLKTLGSASRQRGVGVAVAGPRQSTLGAVAWDGPSKIGLQISSPRRAVCCVVSTRPGQTLPRPAGVLSAPPPGPDFGSPPTAAEAPNPVLVSQPIRRWRRFVDGHAARRG